MGPGSILPPIIRTALLAITALTLIAAERASALCMFHEFRMLGAIISEGDRRHDYRIAVDGAVWQVRGYGFHASAALVREGEGEHEGDGAAFGLVNFGHWPPGAGTFLFSFEDPDDPISEWIGYPYRRLGSAELERLDRRTARTDSGLVGDARLYRFRREPKALLALKMTDGCAVFSTTITIELRPGEDPRDAAETALDQLQRALRLERRPADAGAAKGED